MGFSNIIFRISRLAGDVELQPSCHGSILTSDIYLSVVFVYLDFSVVLRLPAEVLLADRVRVKPVSICRYVIGNVVYMIYSNIDGISELFDIHFTVSSRFWCSKRQYILNSIRTSSSCVVVQASV